MFTHVQHLKAVFQVLADNQLCVKLNKCTFVANEVEYLGHTIVVGEVKMDRSKVDSVLSCQFT